MNPTAPPRSPFLLFPRGLRRRAAGVLAATAGVLMPADGAGPVVLDEVLADNRRAVPVAGRYPDYVELRNASGAAVDLGGCRLTDDAAGAATFEFPRGTVLAPGARVVVWCDRDPGLPPPQAGFGIGTTGDRIRFTGPDGQVWDELAFGLQVADLALGRFGTGEGTWGLVRPSPGAANVAVELGDPARLRLNEWMASPSAGDDWIELYNADAHPVSLGGVTLTDSVALPPIHRPVPGLSFIAARGFVQFHASDLRRADADHLEFRLGAGGEEVVVVASDGATFLDRVQTGAQTTDVSSGRTPDGGEAVMVFGPGRATPGSSNARELVRVWISEVLAHTDPPREDAIELHNPTAEPVDIGHWWLSDSESTPRKFRIPAGTVLAPGGHAVFYEFQFGAGTSGFSLNSYEGDEVWLSVGAADGNLTGERGGIRFGATRNGVSLGRVETSAGGDFAPLLRTTFGADAAPSLVQFRQGRGGTNAPPRAPEAVLAEVFPGGTGSPAQYAVEPFLELANPGAARVSLFDPLFPANTWRVRGDLRWDLPPGVVLEPGERVVIVGFDPGAEADRLGAFRRAHGIAEARRILGPWQGELDPREFSVELQAPDAPEGPDKPRPGFVPYLRMDRLDYRPAAGWPVAQGASLRSLRRADLRGHGNEPRSWAWETPSPGSELPADPNLDTDLDGMPDVWEIIHGFDPRRASDAGEDSDGDGSLNEEEYRAGTDPRQSMDVLRLTIRVTDRDTVRVVFPSVAGRIYWLEARTLSGSGSAAWAPVGEPLAPVASGETGFIVPIVPDARLLRVTIPFGP